MTRHLGSQLISANLEHHKRSYDKKKKSEFNVHTVTINKIVHTNPVQMIKLFLNYFTEIGPNLVSELPTSSKRFEQYITHGRIIRLPLLK